MSRDSSAASRATLLAQIERNRERRPRPRYALTYFGNSPNSTIEQFGFFSGESVLIKQGPLNPGFRFMGWNTLSNGTGTTYQPNTRITIGGTTAFYAMWVPTYQVTYASTTLTSGTLPTDSFLYIANEVVTVKENTNLTRTNFTFYGWNTSENGTGAFYFPSSSFLITSNITLYVIWNPTFRITYDGGTYTGGTVPTDTTRYIAGPPVTIQPIGSMVKENHVFTRWTFTKSGIQSFVLPNSRLTLNDNLTLTAVWARVYTVTYYANGPTSGPVPTDATLYVQSSIITVKSDTMRRTNFRFLQWNTMSDGSGVAYIPTNQIIVNDNVQLYAIWGELFPVTYDGNGFTYGIVPVDDFSPYISGNLVRVQNMTATKNGFRFIGWNTAANSSGTSYSPVDLITIESPLTLYAVWQAMYTVTYDGNGITDGMVPDNVDYLSNAFVTVSTIGSATKTMSRFARWNTSADGLGTSYLPFDVFRISESVTLYAIWENLVTITYNGNGFTEGTVPVDNTMYLSNSVVTVSTIETAFKINYRFARWNTTADGLGTSYAPYDSFQITQPTTLYAIWESTYTVTYNGNGFTDGTIPVDNNIYISNSFVVPQQMTATKLNFRFSQWNTESNGQGTSYLVDEAFQITEPTTLYAVWLPNKYKVSYNGNTYTGGIGPEPVTYEYGFTETVPGNLGLYYLGYIFQSWNTMANGLGTSYLEGNTFTVVEDVTLYAQWTPSVYQVTYDANGGTGAVPTDTASYLYNQNVTTKLNVGLTRTGYTFEGWNSVANGSDFISQESRFKITENTTLYAVWSSNMSTVTYNGNGFTGGNVPTELAYAYNAIVTVSANTGLLVRAGNTFAGWQTLINNVRTDYNVGSTFVITTNVVLYAKWTCTVTYDANNGTSGTVPAIATYLNGSTITISANTGNLARTGNTFAGWYMLDNGARIDYVVGDTRTIIANVVLYARWTCTVTYDANSSTSGSVPAITTYNNGGTVTLSANTGTLTRTGATFSGWYTLINSVRTDYAVGDTFTITENTTVYARWTCTVTYNGNGNSGGLVPVDYPYNLGSTVTVLGNPGTLVRANNTFAGWYTFNGVRTDYVENDTFTISQNVTLYAKWTCTVTYNGNTNTSGSAPTDATVYVNGDSVMVRPHGVLDKTGYTFGGWYDNANATGLEYTTFTITRNVTLYAKWLIRTYTITYDGNNSTGGSVPISTTGIYNTTTTVKNNAGILVRNQYRFTRWNTAADGSGTTYNVGDTILYVDDITLYAMWIPTYAVIYNPNLTGYLGTQLDSNRYITGETVTVKDKGTFSKTGNTFKEWYSNPTGMNGTAYATGSTITVANSNITLYAIWTCRVTYDANSSTSGTVPAIVTYIHGETVTRSENSGTLARTGNTFAGWYTLINSVRTYYAVNTTFTITEDTTLYAWWTARVTYDANNSTSGSVPAQVTYNNGVAVAVSANTGTLARTGNTLTGWYTLINNVRTDYALGSTFIIVEDTTLYAWWTCKVTYDANSSTSGSVPAITTYTNGATATLSANTGILLRTGNTFAGWYTLINSVRTDYVVGSTFTITEDTTVYAWWTCTVTYNGNSSTSGSVPEQVTYTNGATVTRSENTGILLRTGNTFAGWYTLINSVRTNYATGTTFTITENITLYAWWTCTVTYDANSSTSGSVPEQVTYTNGATANRSTNTGTLARTGNTFAGWYTLINSV